MQYGQIRKIPQGLSKLLNTAIELGLIANEKFTDRDIWAQERAKTRFNHEITNKMKSEGIAEMMVDYSSVKPTEEDLNHDWLTDFVEAIPAIRNEYAHGSEMLYHTVLHTFNLVSQMINQLFPIQKIE